MPHKTKKAAVTITIARPKGRAPEHLLANAELHFHTGFLAGIRLTGMALWKATSGEGRRFIAVTFPNRAVEREDGETNYFDHLRGAGEAIKQLKGALVQAYRDFARTEGLDVPEDQEAA